MPTYNANGKLTLRSLLVLSTVGSVLSGCSAFRNTAIVTLDQKSAADGVSADLVLMRESTLGGEPRQTLVLTVRDGAGERRYSKVISDDGSGVELRFEPASRRARIIKHDLPEPILDVEYVPITRKGPEKGGQGSG